MVTRGLNQSILCGDFYDDKVSKKTNDELVHAERIYTVEDLKVGFYWTISANSKCATKIS
jgi:hypothetical protein